MKTPFTKLCLLAVIFCMLLSFISCGATSSESEQISTPNLGESTSIESSSDLISASSLVSEDGNKVIIIVDADYMSITESTVLIEYMQKLKADGALHYTLSSDGMVNSINGQENPADWSKCWMLYSNDAELSNEAWGTVTVGNITYFSAVLGAETLPIKDGKTYVWEFKSF